MSTTCTICKGAILDGKQRESHTALCAEVSVVALKELLAATLALIETLPRCSNHPERPATRAHTRGGDRYCDLPGCGTERPFGLGDVPEYPRAAPLRVLLGRCP